MAKFLKERSRYLINTSLVILLGLSTFALLLIFVFPAQYYKYLYPLIFGLSREFSLLLFVATIVLLIVIHRVMRHWEKVSDNYLNGDTGELKIQKILKQLPEEYQILPDIKKTAGGNIDFVVVGPTGVFALEVKNYHGHAKIDFDGKRLTGNGKTFSKDILQQTIQNATYLGHKLRTDLNDQYIFVTPVLIFAGRQVLRFGQKPVKDWALVIRSEYLLQVLTKKGQQSLSSEKISQITAALQTAESNKPD